MTSRQQYMIGRPSQVPPTALPVDLSLLAMVLAMDRQVTLIRELGSPPDTLVVAMDNAYAGLIQQRFAGRLVIEPDSPMTSS